MMRKNIVAAIALLSISIMLTTCSCVNNKKEVLFGCDSTNAKFATTILPIITNNCYQCHSSANAPTIGGSVNLEGYTNLRNWVSPTNSTGGILLTNVKSGRMPKNLPKISDCDIAKISNWIKAGALNN